MSDIALPIRASGPPLAERLLSDERLAKLAGRGDERAFATLYKRHHQAIYRYCRSIVRDDHDAQDALQSTMTHAYTALCARERDLAVRPWLFRIAHNEAISVLRRRRPEDRLVDVHESPNGDVARTAEERERLATLVADLQALPERQRSALLMRELSGLSIAEIAGALSVSTGAAKQTLFEARGSLHELAKGRAMECEAVRRAISDHDGRVLRGRGLRAHLRDCAACRDFHASIDTRGADLRALAPPLPAALAGATLSRLLAGGGGGGGGHVAAGVSATAAPTAGGQAGASLVAKGLAGVAVIAASAAGTVHLTAGHAGSPRRSPAAVSGSAHPRSRGTGTLSTSAAAANRAVRSRPSASSASSGGRPAAPAGSASPGTAPWQRASGGALPGAARSSGQPHGARAVGSHGNGNGARHTAASRGQRHAHGRSAPKRPAPANRHAAGRPSGSPRGSHGASKPSGANGSGSGQTARPPQPPQAQAGGTPSAAGQAGEAREQTPTQAPRRSGGST